MANVVTNPTSDQSIVSDNLLPAAGNQTQSLGDGSAPWNATLLDASVQNLEGDLYADQFSGATVTAQINNALAAAGNGPQKVIAPSTMSAGNPTNLPTNEVIYQDNREGVYVMGGEGVALETSSIGAISRVMSIWSYPVASGESYFHSPLVIKTAFGTRTDNNTFGNEGTLGATPGDVTGQFIVAQRWANSIRAVLGLVVFCSEASGSGLQNKNPQRTVELDHQNGSYANPIYYGPSRSNASHNDSDENNTGLLVTSVGIRVSITAWSITSNVATFTTVNNDFVAGQQATLNSFSISTFFNGQTVTILSSGLSATQFEVNFTHANGSATESGVAEPLQQGGIGVLVSSNNNPYADWIRGAVIRNWSKYGLHIIQDQGDASASGSNDIALDSSYTNHTASIGYLDNGTEYWAVLMGSSHNFKILDQQESSLSKLTINTGSSGSTQLDAGSSGTVDLAVNSGTAVRIGAHLGQPNANSDFAGSVAILSSTSKSVVFSKNYTGSNPPVVVLTPTSDPTFVGAYWVTYSGSSGAWTGFTVNVHISGSTTFNYVVIGNPI